jgi:PIN domain nuclease of toxin-antitoxin system
MILLDSHVFLWLLTARRPLGKAAARSVERASMVYVSAATVWELAIKTMLGKVEIPDDLDDRLEPLGYSTLDVTAKHGAAIRRFPELMRHDPFHRLLVAQAAIEGLQLLTADRMLLALGRPFIVDATV